MVFWFGITEINSNIKPSLYYLEWLIYYKSEFYACDLIYI